MIRMFNTHSVRRQTELGGTWKLEKLSEDEKVLETYSAVVPSCWESIRGLEDYRGHCRYTKSVRINGGNIRLVFKGVSHTADIFWDGRQIAHHYNAYTPFETVIEQAKGGIHEIQVVADNRFSDESTLHFPNDYRSYGGITRPVVIEELTDAYLYSIHVSPSKSGAGWRADVKTEIRSIGGAAENMRLILRIAGKTVELNGIEFTGNVCVLNTALDFDGVDVWSCESPVLYAAEAVLYNGDSAVDDLYERFGFREVKVESDKILLNGKPLYIKGFNRHEDYGTLGCAVPEQVMNNDIDIILSTGANLIRTCHYPNDERFLDLCDERGVLVWEEVHSRQIYLSRMQNRNFKKQISDCIDEMILNHYNHPSIILWGIMNECESYSEYGRECYILQYDRIKTLDTTRPTTSASNKYFKDICYDLPDVVSLNVYPLWYYDKQPVQFLSDVRDYVNKTGGAGKPVIISEFGAGAIYGYRAFSDVKWSEERQAEILREIIEDYYKIDDLSGLIVWQFADGRVDSEFVFQERPKTQNNKGIVDIYRRPKLSYYTVRECFGKRGSYRTERGNV